MKILFVGDAVVSTGFARCTHAACDALHSAGHQVCVLGINYFGDPHAYPYPIFPPINLHDGGRDIYGIGRLPRLTHAIKPDVIVLLNDPWNVKGYLKSLSDSLDPDSIPPVVGWLAVDGKNQVGHELNPLLHVVVWTDFAARELQKGGYLGEPSVVNLGVDHNQFYPRDRDECRASVFGTINLPADAFVIGVVGRNQVRKRLDLTIEYFSHFTKSRSIDNAYLLLHVAPTGETGTDIQSLCNYYGISDRVLILTPNIGHGVSDSRLCATYNCMDVLVSTSQGEGWGLQVSEAMACGIPCIVPDWSGLGSDGGWPGDSVVSVPCTSTALTAPLNALAHTIGGIPDRATFVSELYAMYSSPLHRKAYHQRGLRRADTLSWDRCGREFATILEQAMSTSMKVMGDRAIISQVEQTGVAVT